MRTVATLAIGFWMGRMFYMHYDKKKAQKKQETMSKRLEREFSALGVTKDRVKNKVDQVLGSNKMEER